MSPLFKGMGTRSGRQGQTVPTAWAYHFSLLPTRRNFFENQNKPDWERAKKAAPGSWTAEGSSELFFALLFLSKHGIHIAHKAFVFGALHGRPPKQPAPLFVCQVEPIALFHLQEFF